MCQTPPASLSPEQEAFVTKVAGIARGHTRRFLLVECEDDYEDIAQDLALECVAGLQNGTWQVVGVGIESFVRAKVLRRILNLFRTNLRRDVRDTDYADEISYPAHAWMSPDAYMEERELDALIDRTIASLPPKCRRVYLMVRDEGASYREVGAALGVSRSAICKQIVLAQSRLRTAIIAWRDGPNDALTRVRTLSAPSDAEAIPRRSPSAA